MLSNSSWALNKIDISQNCTRYKWCKNEIKVCVQSEAYYIFLHHLLHFVRKFIGRVAQLIPKNVTIKDSIEAICPKM